MNATVQKWGNSLALRIPHSLAKDIHLHQGSAVEMAIVDGAMLVNPKGQPKYSLSRMLRRVTRHNRHSENDWGRAAGEENL